MAFRQLALSACMALLLAAVALAQPVETISSTASAVRFDVSSDGVFALNPVSTEGSFFYPRESKTSYLFGGGLWFGAQKKVDGETKKLVFITYNPKSGVSWAKPGEWKVPELGSAADTNIDPHIYTSTEYSRLDGSYLGNDSGRHAWPLWITPETGPEAIPLSTGTFDPFIPLRGAIHGGSGGNHMGPAFVAAVDEQMVTRFHDRALARYEIINGTELAGYPLGLQVEEIIYGWGEGKYRNAVVVQYHIRNTSSDTLFNCVIGQASDPDLGMLDNDRVRFYNDRPDLRTGFFWSDPDTLGTYGTLLMSLIESPNTDSAGMLDNTSRENFRLGGRVGSFPYWSDSVDPKTSAERYDFMTSGQFASDMKAEDQLAMLASNVFTMRPGDTAHFAMMYAVLDSLPPQGNREMKQPRSIAAQAKRWDALEYLVSSVCRDYYSGVGFLHETQSEIAPDGERGAYTASIVPNPATDAVSVRFVLKERGRTTLRLANSLGQTVIERELGMLGPGGYSQQLDLAGVPAGFYMAVIESSAGVRAIPMTIRR